MISRRSFIKSATLIGASVIINPFNKNIIARLNTIEIQNDFFTFSFDEQKGLINISRTDGTPLLQNGTVCANLKQGSEIERHFISSGNYIHSIDKKYFKDILGEGEKLIIHSKDQNKKIDFEIHLSLYNKIKTVTFEAVCKNVSSGEIALRSLEPIRVIKNEGGLFSVPNITACLTNGVMYYNPGILHQFGTGYTLRSDIKEVKLVNGSLSSENETVNSWWNACLFSGYDREGIVLGYLQNDLTLGQLLLSRTAPGEISFTAESVYHPYIILQPGKSISSNRFMIYIADDPYTALENYAYTVGKFQNARTNSIINGWCSWFYTLSQVSEDEVIANTEFASKHLKQYGLEYIQIDEGFQRWHGDWEGNERFPHGMKWLADKIKSYGFKAGLWISPYIISETTDVFKEHPEWLLKKADGSLKRVGNWQDENEEWVQKEFPKRYCLDITHPGAAEWMYNLFDTIANKWGYEMIKIDFVAWSILAAEKYYDESLSAAEVYRKGYEIMRKAVGEKCHLLECGPGNTTVGLIDSMRIEADINYGYSDTAWKTYFLDPASSSAAAGKRYYFHKRTWINDADHICMSLLTNQQAEAAATIIAMSGGNMISGDRLTQLDAYKIEILKKITPSFGEAAFPVDLFDNDIPLAFALKIKKDFCEWTVAAFFNSDLQKTAEKKFPLNRLRLNPVKTYLAFDFWRKKFIGEISEEINVNVLSGSVTLLSLHEKSEKPQFIATDRHITQGAIEIEKAEWNESSKKFVGISTGPINSSHNVYIYFPEPHPWTWGGHVLYHDYDSYSLKSVNDNIVEVNIRFNKAEKVEWEIDYEKFFG